MKGGNCHYGEHFIYESDDDINEPIELIQCPFGDKVFHLPEKRCSQFPKRKDAERRDGYA